MQGLKWEQGGAEPSEPPHFNNWKAVSNFTDFCGTRYITVLYLGLFIAAEVDESLIRKTRRRKS